MESQQDFQRILSEFTPEGEEDIDGLDLLGQDPIPRAIECEEESAERLIIEGTEHTFNVTTFADWFSKYSSNVSSVRSVKLLINGVDPDESIVVTVPTIKEKDSKNTTKDT